MESKEIARNSGPSTDIESVSTFKRSTRATAQGSSLASAYNLPPTFTNHSTQSHCPRCNQLFSLYKEGPTGWNTKPYSMCLNCYRDRRRQKRRNGHVAGPSLQAVQPSNTVTPHLGVVHSFNASEQEYEPSSLEATNCQGNIASHQVFQEGKWISSPMQGHPEILVNIFIDGATHSGAPAKVARNVEGIADTGAQTNVWSLDAFLQCGFDRNILTPSADLVTAIHTVISIAGAFHAIIEGTTFDRCTIQCRAMVYVSAGIHALYLSQHTLHDLGVVSPNFPAVGEHHISEEMQSVVPAKNAIFLQYCSGVSTCSWCFKRN